MTNIPTLVVANHVDHYESWPGLTRLTDGTLICGYSTCNTNLHTYCSNRKAVIRKSSDNGLTWGSEITSADLSDDTVAGGLLTYIHNGVETIFQTINEQTQANPYGDMYGTLSTNGGTTFGTPFLIKTNRAGVGKPVLLSNGTIVTAVYNASGNVYIEKSVDNCIAWTETQIATNDAHVPDESVILEVKTNGTYQGKILMISRTESGGNFKKYLSTDYGVTWDSGTLMTFPAYISAKPCLVRFNDNTLLFQYSDSDYFGRVYKSNDEGTTWTELSRVYYTGLGIGYPSMIINGNMVYISWCVNDPTYSDVYISFMDLTPTSYNTDVRHGWK